jgi:hypothetical protein
MAELKMTKEVYEFISKEIEAFNEITNNEYDMDFKEVLFSFLESTETTHYVLNDWDEGKNNDPYWDEVKNMHSCYSFLEDMNKKIKLNFC